MKKAIGAVAAIGAALSLIPATASAAPMHGCRAVSYTEDGYAPWGYWSGEDGAFAIKVSGISCAAAGPTLTYPRTGYDMSSRHGSRGLRGFSENDFVCSAHTVYPPMGKFFIRYMCHRPGAWIKFAWSES